MTLPTRGSISCLRERVLQLAVDVEQRVLGSIEEHQLPRIETAHLATDLGADASAGAGDEHGLARDELADELLVQLDGIAAQKVRDVHVAELRDRDPSGQDLVQLGNDLHPHGSRLGELHDPSYGPRRRVADGDDGDVGTELLRQLRELVRRSQNPQPVNDRAVLVPVVVDEAHGTETDCRIRVDLAGDHDPRGARSDDQGPACRTGIRPAVALPPHLFLGQAPHGPHGDDPRGAEDELGGHHAERYGDVLGDDHQPEGADQRDREVARRHQDHRPGEHGAHDARKIANGDEAPGQPVNTEQAQDREAQDHQVGQHEEELLAVDPRWGPLEPDGVGQEQRAGDDGRVDQHLHQPCANEPHFPGS